MKYLLLAAPLALPHTTQAPEDLQLMPGYWVMTTHMTEIDLPQQSADFAAQVADSMGPQLDVEYQCISEDEAMNPDAQLFAPTEPELECSFPRDQIADGRIAVNALCADPEMGLISMEFSGAYELMTMRGTISASTAEDADIGPLIMRGTVYGQYVGECPPDEEATG